MLFQEVSLLVTCLLTTVSAIRVDWGTNKGPIVPPTPRPSVVPLPPYRSPAPVWEDQSNDIPNPNPYVYVPPPPSRPRYNNPENNNNNYSFNQLNYGMLVPPAPALPAANAWNAYYQPQASTVASLAPKYVPGVGIQYYAVIPKQNDVTTTSTVATSLGYKLQGKYNAKTKKHKVYEKHISTKPTSHINEQSSEGSQYELQQLPILTGPQTFQQGEWHTEPTPTKLAWKWKGEQEKFSHKQQKHQWSKLDYSHAPNSIHS